MMRENPTVIIGGGVVGVCCAYELARAGVPTILLERGEIAGEASWGNAGQMAIGHPPIPRPGLTAQALKWMFDSRSPLHISPAAGWSMIPWLWRFWRACSPRQLAVSMETLAEMGRQTKPLFDEFIDNESIDCDYQHDGIMDVFRSERGAASGREYVSFMQKYGFDVSWLDGPEVEQREPAFRPGVVGAAFNAESTSLDPATFVEGLAEGARRHGADIRANTPIQTIQARRGAVQSVALESGEVIETNCVVLAAGIWSTPMARAVGVRIPMQAGKGYHRDLQQDEPRLTTPCVLAERFVACTPIGDRLRLAGTLEFTGVNADMNRTRLDALTEAASLYLTGVEGKETLTEWCGLRPCPADGLPIIGWAPRINGLCVATGHSMLGMTLGPITGRIVRDLVKRATPSLPIDSMRVARF